MATERDEYFIGERVNIDCLVKIGDEVQTDIGGTTPVLTILPPPDNGTARDDVDVTLVITSPLPTGALVHGEYDTEFAGWHEWRMVTTGIIKGAQQGRFRVIPINV